MNAFISWSGSRGLRVAQAVKQWIEQVVPGLRCFISPDLPKGERWFDELARELKEAHLGLMCLVPPRVAGEWQLIEAGAIWKASRGGSLFPLCFGVASTEIPEPLQAFQATRFDKDDLRRLARRVAQLVRPQADWARELEPAFEAAWPALQRGVEAALREPDDGVRTPRGLVHALSGAWWERVRSADGGTRLSWASIERSPDGMGLTISGRGFGERGRYAAEWRTDLTAVDPKPSHPVVSYYWEGRHPSEPDLLYGGLCTLRFTISPRGSIDEAAGEFRDVCMTAAREPTTKLVEMRRATPAEVDLMAHGDESARRALVARMLEDWV